MYLFLYTFWILLNGAVTPEILLIGLLVVALLSVLVSELFGYTIRRDLRILSKVPLFLAYLAVLLVEIFKANFHVTKIVLNPRHKVEHAIILLDPGLKTTFGRYVLANSITLTPGTITVRAEEDRFTVHCLDRSVMDGFTESRLVRLLKKLEA